MPGPKRKMPSQKRPRAKEMLDAKGVRRFFVHCADCDLECIVGHLRSDASKKMRLNLRKEFPPVGKVLLFDDNSYILDPVMDPLRPERLWVPHNETCKHQVEDRRERERYVRNMAYKATKE